MKLSCHHALYGGFFCLLSVLLGITALDSCLSMSKAHGEEKTLQNKKPLGVRRQNNPDSFIKKQGSR